MIIKTADDKNPEISALEALCSRPDVSPDVRKRIEQEIRNVRAGIKGEKDAAYEIDFHFGTTKNYAIIHDLRIECEGRVAQIDHLLIGRFLDMWICETKSFSEGIAINDHGECSRYFGNKPSGMASPFEQNKKHIMVLNSLFKAGIVQLPRRLGFAIKPNMIGVVLVSQNARITRPRTRIPGVESIVKCDQFRTMIERTADEDSNPLTMAKLIGTDTLESFARALAAQHKPIAFRWAAKFGLQDTQLEDDRGFAIATEVTPPPLPNTAEGSRRSEQVRPAADEGRREKKKLICVRCAEPVEFKVARFCWLNKARFGDNIYCRTCQKLV